MEASASAPVLRNEDYKIPCHGVGLTGHEPRVVMGPFSKDKGTYSSRINQITRQAGKVPGPGKYVAHDDWQLKGGSKFPNGNRDYKPMNKTPAPDLYESKEFYQGKSIGGNENLSNRRRIVLGHCPKGNRRSFLEGAIKHGSTVPAPGTYHTSVKRSNMLDINQDKTTSWAKEMVKTKGRGPTEKELGPDYNLNWKHLEESAPSITVPKAKADNFLAKAVKEKWSDAKTKKELPGPGTYAVHNFDDSKITRGTKYLQTRGFSRSSVSGYF